MMRAFLLALAVATTQACGGANEAASSGEAVVISSDAVIKARLTETLAGVTFAESDAGYPFSVFDGDGTGITTLTTDIVRERLGTEAKRKSSSQRDLVPPGYRGAIEPDITLYEERAADTRYTDAQRNNYKQHALALRYMKQQLRNVVQYRYGVDQTGERPGKDHTIVLIVGISRNTTKLIALMSEFAEEP